ncbi:hypothetical protein FIV34_17610 [Luteibacter pinisoli]|uniref:Histidine kinase/HSP90-like ATPase domain-containing protein n=1 Tax=Luteibacter pinisoli TaxID=2589080 RepID=A0A4Y5Z6Q1_9GAMM|nr:sensor histidine kinase [Luteibacter pinisoli]QDE40897.1 hypothetical protein FIV34_17610 [Luteibacter pinisoli]
MRWNRRFADWAPSRTILALLLGAMPVAPALATPADIPGYVTSEWRTRDGAPGDIRSMAQTKDGWLWLGTSSGLFRFDGQTFAAHDLLPDTFPGSRGVTDMAALPDGGLLVMYGGAVVMHLAADGVTATRPDGLPADSVDGVMFDGSGRVFAAAEGKLFTLTGDHWTLCHAPSWRLPATPVDGATLDASGALIVNAADGVYRLAPGSNAFERVSGVDPAPEQHLFGTADGRMWRTRKAGFELLPGLTAGNLAIGSGSSIFANDGRGAFWSMQQGCPSLCLRREGLDPAQGSMSAPALYRLPEGRDGLSAMSLLADRAGNLWVGGKDGLVRFHPTDVRPMDMGYEAFYFTLMPMDDGSMLAGAESNWKSDDLVRFTPTGRVVVARGAHTHALARWPNGKVLHVDRSGPLSVVDGNRLVPWSARPDKANDVLTLVALPAGNDRAWVGLADMGLFLVTPQAWTPVGAAEGFPKQSPSVGGNDDAGRTWFGYADGKLRDVKDGHVVEGGTYDTGLGAVTALLPGKPLIAGGEQGVAWFDGKAFHPLRLRTPGILRGVTGLARTADGALWAYGRAGLVRIDGEAFKAVMEGRANDAGYRILTNDDGLAGGAQQSRSFTSLTVDAKGLLWAAGALGLVTVDPATVKPPSPVRPVILSLASGHHGPLPSHGATLPPGDASLEVAFTGLSLDDPKHVQLRYRLRGSDDTWHDADGADTVRFDQLAPGSYQFELQARNSEGEWSPVVSSSTIVRTPAFTETLLFRCLVGLACLAALFILYTLRMRSVRQRHRERINAKLAERDRIASELHDSILQGTQAIAIRLSGWELDTTVPESMRERIKVVSRQMKGIVLEGRARVVALRSVGQGGMSLSDALRLIGDDHEEASETAFELFVVGEETELPDAVQVPVLDILREAIHNAFLHAQAARVMVTIDFSAGTLRATVQDDGCGLPADVLEAGRRPGHWGLVIMRERAIAAGADFAMASSAKGTSLTLTIAIAAASARRTVT